MPVTLNARGTSVPFFTIGKKGTTIYQGTVDPVGTYTIINGDYWLDSGTSSLKTRISNTWLAPKLNSLTIPTGVGASGQSLVTDGTTGILSFADRVSSVSVTTANGVSGTVATSTTTPAITLTLGAITPSSVTTSGVVATSLGTAALPSHTFATDLDTGIYSPGANQVAITVAGAQVVNFLSTGLDMNGGHIAVGDAGISANALINGVETYAPDATRYGTLMDVTIDNTVPIIANRTYYGNQAIIKMDLSDTNRAGFTTNTYGAYLETRFGTAAGGESAITTGTGSRNYVQNWAATGIATDLRGTWSNILHSNALSNASSFAAYNHIQMSSTATGTVDNAYGTYNRLDQDAGTLTRAYGIFNSFEGTIGRKIGMYSAGGTSLDVAAASTVPLTFGHYSAGSDLVLPRLTFDTAGVATFGSNVIINTGASTSTQSLAVINTGTNGSNILITGNGATTPNKYIRVQSGVFQIINSAYASPILAITDAGVLTTPSILDANLTGIPVAPTAALGTSTTQVATTAFVRTNSGLFTVSPPPAPSSPSPGDRWLSTDSGRIYTYFNDGDSSQWAEFAGDAGIVANGVTIPVINPPTPKEGDYRIVGGVLSFWIAGAWVQSIPAIYA